MTAPTLTDDELVGVFLRSLDLLTIVDNRVQLNPLTFRDLNTIVGLCFSVEAINRAEDTPVACALVRLACTTAALLTTAAVISSDDPVIVAQWRSSLEEYRALTEQAGE
jgi:hypothetical protein